MLDQRVAVGVMLSWCACTELTGTCRELVNCTNGCDDGDQSCLDGCAALAPTPVIDAYNALASCSREAGCADDACRNARCASQMTACFGSGGAGGGGGSGTGGGAGAAGGAAG